MKLKFLVLSFLVQILLFNLVQAKELTCAETSNGDYQIDLVVSDLSTKLLSATINNMDWSGLGRGEPQIVEEKVHLKDRSIYIVKTKGNRSLQILVGSGLLIPREILLGNGGLLCLGTLNESNIITCQEYYSCSKH